MKKAILINDTSNEHHMGCDTVISNIKYLCILNGIEIIDTFTRNHTKNQHKRLENGIKACDIVIINGEGTLHDQYGRNFLQPLLAKIPKGKKTVLINSVWHNMGMIHQLEKLSLISLRETNSLLSFRKDHPTRSGVIITPDVIFYRQPKETEIIGYGDSVYGNIASQLNKWGNYFPLDYRRDGSPLSINIKKDDVNDYIRWLKSTDLHITGRFHGVCLSAIAGTPFLALKSNALKIEGILKDMGCSELLIANTSQISAKKEIAYNLAHKAYEYARVAHVKVEDLFKRIKAIAYEET
jgi:hypothetical protein